MVATIHSADSPCNTDVIDLSSRRKDSAREQFLWIETLVDRCGQQPAAMALALHIRSFCDNPRREGFPSKATLAARAGFTVRYVEQLIRVLVAAGLVEVRKGGGRSNLTTYALVNRYAAEETTKQVSENRVSEKQETPNRVEENSEPDFAKPRTLVPTEVTKETPRTKSSKPGLFEQQAFDEFWKVYPRRAAKKAAQLAWSKAVKTATPETIISAALAYHASRMGKDPQHTAHAATWLNGERWTDEPQTHTGQTHERTNQAGGGKPRGGGFGRLYETSDADTSNWRLAVDGETAQ